MYVLYDTQARMFVSKRRPYYNTTDLVLTTELWKAKLFTNPKTALKGSYANYWSRNTMGEGPAWVKLPRSTHLVALKVNASVELPATP